MYLNGVLATKLFHADPTTQTNMAWQPFSYGFTATAATTTLTIRDTTNRTPYQGMALGGLTVNPQ